MGVFNKLVLDQDGLLVGKRQIDASQDGVYFSGNGLFGSDLVVTGQLLIGSNLSSLNITGTLITANTEIRSLGNITAYYSDKRLKKNIEPIKNAVDKIKQINGVTFNSNDVAGQYGYTNTKTQVGVIAQEIEAVLPEVVTRAPFDIGTNEDGSQYSKSGEDYKTVHYDRLVPLLIQAIKEQQSKIEQLEQKIESISKI